MGVAALVAAASSRLTLYSRDGLTFLQGRVDFFCRDGLTFLHRTGWTRDEMSNSQLEEGRLSRTLEVVGLA